MLEAYSKSYLGDTDAIELLHLGSKAELIEKMNDSGVALPNDYYFVETVVG